MKKRANPDSEANIRRIDSKPRAKKQTHGFQVHFLRGTEAVTKMFSDTVYGGKESARRAARKFKRAAMADIAGACFPRAAERRRNKRGERSRSGSAKSGGAKERKPTAAKKSKARKR